MGVIKQIQQAIVYIEDRLLEPFNLQELSDYVGLSPYHLDQSFKMIVGQSPEEYARARKMTIAANDVVNGASRLMDVAKKYRYANSNDFANFLLCSLCLIFLSIKSLDFVFELFIK